MTHLVLPFHRMEEAAPYLDPKRLHYLHEGQSESFESLKILICWPLTGMTSTATGPKRPKFWSM